MYVCMYIPDPKEPVPNANTNAHTHTYIYTHKYIYKYIRMHFQIHRQIHIHIHTDRQTDSQAGRQTDRQTYIHTYIHTSHTHTHIYIYTCTKVATGSVRFEVACIQDFNALAHPQGQPALSSQGNALSNDAEGPYCSWEVVGTWLGKHPQQLVA